MPDTLTNVRLVDGDGATKSFRAVTDGANYTLGSQPFVDGAPVTVDVPLPVRDDAAEGSLLALGNPGDTVWPGTAAGTIVSILKAIWTLLTGNLNFGVTKLAYHGPHNASVGTTSAVLVPAGTYSRALTIQTFPDSVTNVWLRPDGSIAAKNTGILCQGAGGSVSFGNIQYPIPIGDLTAVTDGGGPQGVMISGG